MQEQVQPNGSTPPPCCRQGTKNGHSPWSAPRERKRRSKAAVQPGAATPAQAVLSSIEELECTTSPPKRHQGDHGPAPRGLALLPPQEAPFSTVEAADARGAVLCSGPLAQGLLAAPTAGDLHFSPLASGLRAPSFSMGTTFGFQSQAQPHHSQQQSQVELEEQPWKVGATAVPGGGDKQRKQLRLAAARHRCKVAAGNSGAGGAAAAAAGGDEAEAQQPPSAFCSQLWQAARPGGAQPFGSLVQQGHVPALASGATLPPAGSDMEQQHPPADLASAPTLTGMGPAHLPHFLQQHQHERQLEDASTLPFAAPPRQEQQRQQPAVLTAARCSTGQDMETDLRSSWGSERSADVSGWQALQARLREEVEAGLGADAPFSDLRAPGMDAAAALRRHTSSVTDDGVGAGGGGLLRASAECDGASVRSSLEGPSCSDRQASILPLRTSVRSPQWPSHLPSPRGDGALPDPLLGIHGGPTSSGSSRQRGIRGGSTGHTKWGCFSCASPFSCRQGHPGGAGEDSDEEVVRRNDSIDGFVIRRKQSSTPPSPAPLRDERSDTVAGGSGRLKRAGLNQPPEGKTEDLVNRQGGFSARCSATPCGHSGDASGVPASPYSEAGSDDSFSLPSGPSGLRSTSLSVGLRDASIEELAGGLTGGEDVDALNDMLKAMSLCPTSHHPKDAEALVAKAYQTHSIQPNATTTRTLEKMWAVHEQLYG